MAEINNNIPKFGFNNIEKIDLHNKNNIDVDAKKIENKDAEQIGIVPDTGVLGRSQVKTVTDVSKSVDEAVALAKKHPALLTSSEGIFNHFYQQYLESGMDESDAYMKALMAEEEFLAVGRQAH